MFNIGDKSPDFSVKLLSGREFNLFNTLNNSSVLINFIRGTWCEECTNHLKNIDTWKKKITNKNKSITTIIITVENEEKVKEWHQNNPTTYLVAADQEGSVAKTYGFMVPEDTYSRPGMVLVNPKGEIQIVSSVLTKSSNEVVEVLGP